MSCSSSSFEPYKKQSRMTAFFPKQSEPKENIDIIPTTGSAATRQQVREEYQQVVDRIELLANDDNELWNFNQEQQQRQQSSKSLHEHHGDLSKLVPRSGAPTIQPRIAKKKNLDSAIAKMKSKCLPLIPPPQKQVTGQIKVATLRSDSSLSAKDFEQRLKERIKAKSRK